MVGILNYFAMHLLDTLSKSKLTNMVVTVLMTVSAYCAFDNLLHVKVLRHRHCLLTFLIWIISNSILTPHTKIMSMLWKMILCLLNR